MFEHDRSAARGEMATRGLYVFKHDSELGNAHGTCLFDRIKPKLKEGVTTIALDENGLPVGVSLLRLA
jgi:CRISPR-associated protein Csd2